MSDQATRLPPFSYQVLQELQRHAEFSRLQSGRWLVAVSGGRDSMVLWHMVTAWQKRLGFELAVAHVHHGISNSEETAAFRRRAYELVKALAEQRQQSFFCNYGEGLKALRNLENPENPENPEEEPKTSEEELRRFRYRWLRQWQEQLDADVVVLAHHQQDQLETRLIRLIRGCGLAGLAAMKVWEEWKLRPLLPFAPELVAAYAGQFGVEYVDDPSNRDRRYLRNWLRHEWLPQLEAYRPGALPALERSLETVGAEGPKGDALQKTIGSQLHVSHFLTLTEADQMRQIAVYLETVGIEKFTQGQILEIRKRLLSSRKTGSFHVAGCDWQVNAGQVTARPVVNSQD